MSERVKLPARRRAVTLLLTFKRGEHDHVEFYVTFGFDDQARVREAFCLPFKSGVDLQAQMRQACMAISVGLQYGASMAEFAHVLGEDNPAEPPRSMIGLIVRVGAKLDEENSSIPKSAETAAAAGGVEQRGPRRECPPRAFHAVGVEVEPICAPVAGPAASRHAVTSVAASANHGDSAHGAEFPLLQIPAEPEVPRGRDLAEAMEPSRIACELPEIPEFLRRVPEGSSCHTLGQG